MNEKRIERFHRALNAAYKSLDNVREEVQKLEKEAKLEEYKSVPGQSGVFDGISLVIEDGEDVEVPPNYVAKSRLLCGDRLKVIDENGSKIFKQVGKVERKRVDGIVSKKEGKWYVLTDVGSFRLMDVVIGFNNLEINDEIRVIIPKEGVNVTYAAFDKSLSKKKTIQPEKPVRKPISKKPVKKNQDIDKEFVADISSEGNKKSKTKTADEKPVLDDDDLR